MKKYCFVAIVLFSTVSFASWNRVPCNETMPFDIETVNQRLENLKKLKLLHAKEKFFESHESESIAKEKKFIQEISLLDPDTPYQDFVDKCDNCRFLSDDLVALREKRLEATQEYYDGKTSMSSEYKIAGYTISDDDYYEYSMKNKQDAQKIEKSNHLKKLKKSYQYLQKEMQTYDKYLKSTTFTKKYTHTSHGYNSHTDHYQTTWKYRIPYNVIPKISELPDDVRADRSEILNHPDRVIELYTSNFVDPFLNKYKQLNKKEFNIVVSHDNASSDELTKRFEFNIQLIEKSTLAAGLGATTAIMGFIAHNYFKNK